MRTSVALSVALLLTTSILAQAQDQTVTVGPWTIATSSKAEKFDSCTMSRSTNDLDVSFVRGHDGLLLLLDSSKWKLERGKAYTVASCDHRQDCRGSTPNSNKQRLARFGIAAALSCH
jgi:hypothetical protein